ncbi:integrator complex subunit 2-domain-containing protein [Gigaspora rosea]|uniref:Integrator complex subunit 2-domain-containing protein n=1 Tax=Gigaspora rosea TaxID=44941 RepID=A0A397V6C2_9GLOM|nr:integrator complex subunit 2-domain-containing protein [Gigaspora rosea]
MAHNIPQQPILAHNTAQLPITQAFIWLEKGGDIFLNQNLLQFLDRYLQIETIRKIISVNQNLVIPHIIKNSYPRIPLTHTTIQSQGQSVQLVSHEATMIRAVLQDVYDLVKSASVFYEMSQSRVKEYCDFIKANPLLFKYLRSDVVRNLEYYLPTILYTWDLSPLGINYKDFIRALVLLENGHILIKCMTTNNPQMFEEIAATLIDIHNHLPSDYKIHLRNMLYTMCALAPHHTFFIRMKLTDLKILPEFALELTLTSCIDVPLYLAGILSRDAEWLKFNLFKTDTIATLQNRLMMTLKKELADPVVPPTNHRNRLCVLLRIICGLNYYFHSYLNQNDLEACLQILTHAESDRLRKLYLCFLLLFWQRILSDSRIRPVFTNAFSKLVNPGNSDLYLIFAYLFNTSQFEQIQEICRETLTLDVMIAQLDNDSEAFIRAQFKEDILAKCALEIEPTTSFSGLGLSKVPQDIAFEVFYVMLTGGVFHKGRVDIQSWILRQLLQAEIPIHAKIGSLLKAYVRSIFEDHLYRSPMTKISEERIIEFFLENVTKVTPAHVLMTYYVLTFNDFAKEKKLNHIQNSDQQKTAYSPRLTELIQARRILTEAEKCDNGYAYRNIYPELLGLMASNYPEIFDVESFLIEEDREIGIPFNNDDVKNIVMTVISELEDSTESVLALKKLEAIAPEYLLIQSDSLILCLLPKLLKREQDPAMLDSIHEIWYSLYSVHPHKAALLFINAVRSEEDRGACFVERDIMLDPLVMFRCDSRVFRCPQIFQIFLKVLKFYMVGSRLRLRRAWQDELTNKDVFPLNKLNYMINSQETLLLSLLMKECETKPSDSQNPGILDQIRTAAFRFLHHMFIENMESLRNLHFLGYATDLIPLTTRRIESMHLCVFWAHELISHEDPKKQLFGLCLAGQLCEVWPMQSTFNLAKNFIIPTIRRKTLEVPENVLSDEGKTILPILVLLFNLFNNLRDEVVALLRALEDKFSSSKGYATTLGAKRKSLTFVSYLLTSINKIPKSTKMDRVREILPVTQ